MTSEVINGTETNVSRLATRGEGRQAAKGKSSAHHARMSPDQFRKALDFLHPRYGSQRWFARTVGLNESHVRRYIGGKTPIPVPMTLLIAHLILRKEEGRPIKIDTEEVFKMVEGE